MHPDFVQSFLGKGAASGALTSALRSITKLSFGSSRGGAILFLAIACAFELGCFVLYAFAFAKLPIVKHYRAEAIPKAISHDITNGGTEMLSIKKLLSRNRDYVLDVFLIYLLTLTLFPGFLSEDTGSHSLGTWYPVVVVAMYNLGELIGRYIPIFKLLKMESRRGITIATIACFALIPTFYFAAKYGGEGWIMLLTFFLGLTTGYLTVCIFTLAPAGHKGVEQNAIGNILVLSLMGGVFAGLLQTGCGS